MGGRLTENPPLWSLNQLETTSKHSVAPAWGPLPHKARRQLLQSGRSKATSVRPPLGHVGLFHLQSDGSPRTNNYSIMWLRKTRL